MAQNMERNQSAFDRVQWAGFLGGGDRPILLWIAFNAVLMKLGVVLLRSRGPHV
jgi:hypothetical protein